MAQGVIAGAAVLLGLLRGCGASAGLPLANEYTAPPVSDDFVLVARFAQITDVHVVDEESPGRLSALANLHPSAWRPQERFSLHLLDGTLRAVNFHHARVAPLDFLVHTGDALDNVQANELAWHLGCFDGAELDPVSGVDDRPVATRGPPQRDPHHPFRAAGLYRHGVHGPLPSIPWYALAGNHDRYAIGVFPLVPRAGGGFVAPLPLSPRLGLFLPTALVSDGAVAYGPLTPAHPGPPPDLVLPAPVPPNPDRRFIATRDFIAAHFDTVTGPPGHGFVTPDRGWYSTTPVPGLRLVVLDTSQAATAIPTGFYHDGAVVAEQARFLRGELEAAQAADEIIVVATHHPSITLTPLNGTALSPEAFRATLNAYPNVVLHICGHTHRHRVWDRGGYLEVETAAIIDDPQEGRIFEVWRAGRRVELRYSVFSHLYEGSAFAGRTDLPPEDDPFVELRREARALARAHAEDFALQPDYADMDLPLPDPARLLRARPGGALPDDRDGECDFVLGQSAGD